jgi:stage II sporulation protein D
VLLKKFFILLILTGTFKPGFTQKINIAVFYKNNIKAVIFSTISGKYNILGNGSFIDSPSSTDKYFITAENNILSIRNNEKSFGIFQKIEFTSTDNSGIFRLNPTLPKMHTREYDDDLVIIAKNGNLQIINKINLEKYVAGVVETEGGSYAPPEFYKSQAILIRTYAIKNMYKHSGSGFSLCDDVHCQAYKGKSRNNLINKAVEETRGMVLADMQNNLIITPYHSNCGGLTSNASDVWQKKLPYLVSIKDPFCTQSENAKWIKKISVSDWENYLRKCGIYIENSKSTDYDFDQSSRKKFYHFKNQKILLTRIRNDWNLKSTFFSITSDGNTLILTGRGFGHGVGLCQEGAIEMARVGFTYKDILHFYFQNFRISYYKDINKP